MSTHGIALIAVLAAAAFAIAAGFNDGGNLLAAAASSRTISLRAALAIIIAGVGAGPIVVGTAVAHVIGNGIADFNMVGLMPQIAGIGGGLAAAALSYANRVPTSLSVAFIGGLVGALGAGPGFAAVHWSGVLRVAGSMAGALAIGPFAGAVAYAGVRWVLVRADRRLGEWIVSIQYLTVALLAVGYGSNDLEKAIGLMAAAGSPSTFGVPAWTIFVCLGCFTVGLAIGGVRVAKTVGGKLFAIRPPQALAFQTAAAATVIGAAILGGPLSTTETTASAMVGVGAAVNPRAVHWNVVRTLVAAWVVTMPVAFAAGAVFELIGRSIR